MPISSYDRRAFLKRSGSTIAGMAALSLYSSSSAAMPLPVQLGGAPPTGPLIADPRLKEILLGALDAARAAGATYADVRLVHERRLDLAINRLPAMSEHVAANVRALVDGYWGFHSTPTISADTMAQAGRMAVALAHASTLGRSRRVDLAPTPIAVGHWETPMKIDPFETHPLEIVDHLGGLARYFEHLPGVGRGGFGDGAFKHIATDKAFGSTDGSFCTQRLRASSADIGGSYYAVPGSPTVPITVNVSRYTQLGGGGWELVVDQPLREYMLQDMAVMREWAKLPSVTLEPGRYDFLFQSAIMAGMLNQSIGAATQADRVFGYEANSTGTSFITDPVGMIGTLQVGTPALTVTANRSDPRGLATCRWDDEGVEPQPFTVVDRGVLADLQTGRESASWLREVYDKRGTPIRSHGCMQALLGIDSPMLFSPNLVMTPGPESMGPAALIAEMEDGIAFPEAVKPAFALFVDYQQRTGQLEWTGGFEGAVMVRKGKVVGRVASSRAIGTRFRMDEIWKGIHALGGPSLSFTYGGTEGKGSPVHQGGTSVTAVPAVVKQLALVDLTRR